MTVNIDKLYGTATVQADTSTAINKEYLDKLFGTAAVQADASGTLDKLFTDKLYATVVIRANYTPPPDPTPPEDDRITGGGGYPGYTSPVYRVHPEYDEARSGRKKRKKRLRNDGGNIVIEGPTEIQTGIVEIQPVRDLLAEYERKRMEAERLRIKKLKALREADDDWLLGS